MSVEQVTGRVLVVDDDAASRETVAEVLRDSGLTPVLAGTARQAAEVASRLRLDAAVVDHWLPDGTGVELAGRLKGLDPDLPVLLLTGHVSLESAIAAVGQLDEYLAKPAPPAQLVGAVRAAVARTALTRENRRLVAGLTEANASLAESVEERERELAALAAVAEAVSGSSRVARVLDATVEVVSAAVGTGTTALYLCRGEPSQPAVLGAVREGGWRPPATLAVPPRSVDSALLGGGRDHPCVLVRLDCSDLTLGVLLLERPRLGGDPFLQTLGTQVAVGIDNARRREAERATVERMRELAAMKSSFLANVSHELRTPLTAVIGFARTLQTHGAQLSDGERRELVDRIEGQAGRLRRLVEDLLDATRLERASLRVRNTPVEIVPVLRRVLASFPEPVHRLRLDLPEQPLPLVLADAGRLEQVVTNLLDNAMKYSPVGSTVTVRVAASAGGVAIEVVDQGTGIDPAFLARLFEPFSQADEGDTRRDRGVGLGLAIVQGLVQAMGGRVEVHSEPGHGTRMVVVLSRVLPQTGS